MATITFTDGTGSVTFSNGTTGPMSRFSEWTPDVQRISDSQVGLGNGVTYEYLFRQDFGARFRMERIPLSQITNYHRFKRHALAGSTFTVNTEDKSNRSYVCRIAPGADITLEMEDRVLLEYAVEIDVISAETVPAAMLCEYR
jgi:uncharacterized protein YqfB (UPF0267 family)